MSQNIINALFQEKSIGNRTAELEELHHRCETLETAVLSLSLGVYDLQDYVALYAKYPRLRSKLKKCSQNMHTPLAKYHAAQFKRGGPPIQVDSQYLVQSAVSLERPHVLDLYKQGYHTVAGTVYASYEALVRRSRYYKLLERVTKLLLMFLGVVISFFSLVMHILRRPGSVFRFSTRSDMSFLHKVRHVVQTWFPMFINPERYLRDVQVDTNHRILADLSGTLEANFWNSELGSCSDDAQFDDTISDTASDESGIRLPLGVQNSPSTNGASPMDLGRTAPFTGKDAVPSIILPLDTFSLRGEQETEPTVESQENNNTSPNDGPWSRVILIVVACVLAVVYYMI